MPNSRCLSVWTWNRLESGSGRKVQPGKSSYTSSKCTDSEPLEGSVWKERRVNSLETTYFFSLPIDYKYLEYSTDCKGSEPDFFFHNLSVWLETSVFNCIWIWKLISGEIGFRLQSSWNWEIIAYPRILKLREAWGQRYHSFWMHAQGTCI